MCGIVGYKLLSTDNHTDKQVLQFFRQLLLESQVRGKHATGIAYTCDDKVYSHKRPVPASEFLKDDIWTSKFTCAIPHAMIGHTRYSTSGDWHDNKNNQPLNNRDLALVHNGLVSMATPDEFCYEYRIQTATDNDSEIILRKVIEDDQSLPRSLADVLRDVDPIYAVAMLDKYDNVVIARDGVRPLWLFVVAKWGVLGFASTRDIINRAAVSVGLDSEDYKCFKLGKDIVYTLGHTVASSGRIVKFRGIQLARVQPYLPPLPTPHAGPLPKFKGMLPTAGWDHRTDLRESFKQYCAIAVSTWEIDPNYPMLNYIFKRFEMSQSQQYWACFLYGTFYHPGSVFYVMQEFPEFEKVDLGRLKRWHDANWKKLRYNTDRKYEKGHFVEMFESYRDLIGSQEPDSQDKFFSALIGDDPQESFRNVTKALLKLLRFGRYSVYIYTEALARCMQLPLEADNMFLKGADSPRAGLAIVLGRPDLAKGSLTTSEWLYLIQEAERLLLEVQEEYPELHMDRWFMESCLCAYKGYFRPTKGRYIPYYLDRMAAEIQQMQDEDITSGVDWNVLWQFREECMPWEYLGERCKPVRRGIHKQWEHVLRDTGKMIGLDEAIARGIVERHGG